MKSNLIKSFGVLFLSGMLCTCIEPYDPKVSNYESLLVVDALITDENVSNYVSLEKSIQSADDIPEKVTGATVTIIDDLGNSTLLSEVSDGLYKTDSLIFRGVAGRSYTLHIFTGDGAEYQSETTLMQEARDIDTVYFGKDTEPVENSSDVTEGLRIYIDSRGSGNNQYYRWIYEEFWEFHIMFPKQFDYKNENSIVEIPVTKRICWKHSGSDDIIISSTGRGADGEFIKKPVLFIDPGESDRLLVQYCVDIKQLSVSKKEYDFWYNMQQVSESGGDIFDKPPFPIVSNICNVNDPDETVLGYFQVAGVKHYRRYITRDDLVTMDFNFYHYDCDLVILGPQDPQPEFIPPPVTFDKIYKHYTTLNYIFVQPLYNDFGGLERLEFVSRPCADCSVTGSLKKPDFWVDL